MYRINLNKSNKTIGTIITLLIIIFTLSTIIFPLIMIYVLPQSGLAYYFSNNANYTFITILLLIYFLTTGVYFYKIKIDAYVIDITSYRLLAFLFQKRNYVDISHVMLLDYSFFDRPFSFNKTLMLKIESDSGKIVVKRFNLTLITEKEIVEISKVLDRIIVNNN